MSYDKYKSTDTAYRDESPMIKLPSSMYVMLLVERSLHVERIFAILFLWQYRMLLQFFKGSEILQVRNRDR